MELSHQEVQIAFYQGGNSFIDKMIQWWTSDFPSKWNGRWRTTASHCEVSFGNDVWYGATTRASVGFRARPMILDKDKWRVYSWRVDENSYDVMKATAISFIGKRYDWLNVFGSDIFLLDVGDPNKLTCDEGCARILVYSELGHNLIRINKLTPRLLEEYVITNIYT